MTRRLLITILTLLALGGWSAQAGAQSGQRAIGRSTVEPALDDANGNLIYLLTPDKVPMPSMTNMHAVAPMFLPVYPTFSAVDAATLNCTPTNCNHVNVLPFPAPGYTNGGTTCTSYGLPAGQCVLLKGHDHLVGVPHTGDFNVAWHVELVVFTQQGINTGKSDLRVKTLQDIANLVTNGDATLVDTPITFNCSIVPATVYARGTSLTF